MHAWGVGYFADDVAAIGVGNHDLRRVADIDAVRGGIDGDVVPSAGAADLDFLDDAVRAVGRGEYGERRHDTHADQRFLSHGSTSFPAVDAFGETLNTARGWPAASPASRA